MEIVKKDFGEKSFYDYIFERLRGTVFHLTRLSSFEGIKTKNYIFNNKEKKYRLNVGSEGSYGRTRGYVCLFDFRRSDEIIIEKLQGYDGTLAPHWFEERTDLEGGMRRVDCNVAYLILDPKYYGKLKLEEDVEEGCGYEQRIREIECWFTEDLPLVCIEKVYLMSSYSIVDKNLNTESIFRVHEKGKKK